MAISANELAFFGGWTRRVAAGGDLPWGPPALRTMEIVPSAVTGLVLPPLSDWLMPGVPYWVVNTGTATLLVKRPSDGATVTALTAGVAGMFVYGGGAWFGMAVGLAQFGSVYPAIRYSIDISANAANVDMLQLAVARGYDGTQPASVTCRLKSGVAIGTVAQSLRAWTTGKLVGSIGWAAGSFALLVVEAGGDLGGWGGAGGRGGIPGTGSSGGFAGADGGQAIRAEIPLRIDCQGAIFGGGGGGGGGGSSSTNLAVIGAGGGGGRGMNMTSNGSIMIVPGGAATDPAQSGQDGGPFSHGFQANGVGGLGVGGGGNGGIGGPGGLAGQAGGAGPGSGGVGGAGAAAISYLPAAGAPTILAGLPHILGTFVAEAS